jgi:hypothetical protein
LVPLYILASEILVNMQTRASDWEVAAHPQALDQQERHPQEREAAAESRTVQKLAVKVCNI